MKLKKTIHTLTKDARTAKETRIALSCEDGFSVVLSSIGAGIDQVLMPFPDGTVKNIALTFADKGVRLGNDLYAGATLAPAAGRITGGRLKIDGKVYELDKNENGNTTLHGGSHNASFRDWQLVSSACHDDLSRVVFGITLPDGVDGFPGERRFQAIYTLTEDHTLTIRYEASSSKETYFNLSNHTYWNLSGDFNTCALDQKVQVNADTYTIGDAAAIPEDIVPVENTAFDLRSLVSFAEKKAQYPDDQQIGWGRGWNNAYILRENTPADAFDFALEDPDGRIRLEGRTDAPALVIYTGGYITEGIKIQEDQFTKPSCAVAFEFEDRPDLRGPKGIPFQYAEPGTVWNRTIEYKFMQLRK